ncbi:MAG TPA: YbaK/EbsC family protein [Candidatus Caldiarchaeum subterraneum]|uniref:YbaK/EbsC family protein n=1 Tax=Caldiarchaeum subterraneum TaxID=311458 RepID=A0A833A3E8_CALS0|nr:YbaK/EbsC family protein [Aigarchaeota archaeon]HIQ29418.1 YbaK/EbsC family protein [Candidatus Caldarchaeum subterraneum]
MLGPDELAKYMRENGIEGEIIRLGPSSAKTSSSAAKAVGCDVAQIAKSIVLKGGESYYVVVLSGDRKIDIGRASAFLNEETRLARAGEILEQTGYPVGGVPPFGHANPLKILVDKSLLRFEEVYSSGGSEDTLLRIKVRELVRAAEACGGCVVDFSV